MAVTIPRRRFPETLVFLSFLIPLMLLTPQSHAAAPAASSDYEMTTSIKVVINKGDTYDMTIVGQRKSRSSSVKEDSAICSNRSRARRMWSSISSRSWSLPKKAW